MKKHLFVVGAIIAIIALFGFGKTDAKADQEVVTEWFSEPHPEYFVYADCVEETAGGENAVHYVYERYLWHDGKTWRATSKRLVPTDYTLNKYITSRDYGGVGKNTKKYNLWLSKEYDYPVQEESGGGYNVESATGEQFHAWGFYTVTVSAGATQYRYRYTIPETVELPVWDGGVYTYSLGGYYNIKTVPGLAFDVAWGGKENGSNLMIWDFNNNANQRFNFSQQNNGSYVIYDSNSGLCIDIAGDIVSGSNICMNAYNGSKSQQWYVGKNNDGTYSLISSLSASYVMDIENGTDGLAESNVHLWQWHGGQNQRFYIEKIDGTGSKENEIITALLNMPNGFELKNKNSGRMLNLYHGKTNNGAKFDTYPRDYTKTERFQLIISDKGLQFRNYCSEDKRMDVKTNGTGTPIEGNAVCLYKPTSDNCSYWEINYCGSDSTGDYINIESVKTPGLYVGHPDNDLDGTKRKGLVLCEDGAEDRCLWYIYNPDSTSEGDETTKYIDSLMEQDYLKNGDINFEKLFSNNKTIGDEYKKLFEKFPLGSEYAKTNVSFPLYNKNGTIKREGFYLSSECFAFCELVSSSIFKCDFFGRDGFSVVKVTNKSITNESISYQSFVDNGFLPGRTFIKTVPKEGGFGHSLVILGYTEKKVVIADNNVAKPCNIRIHVYSWDDFRLFLAKKGDKRKIDKIVVVDSSRIGS